MTRKNFLSLALSLAVTVITGASLVAFAPAPTAIGSAAPSFTLTDLDGKSHSLADFKGKTVVLEWTNPNCPFVVAHYKSNNMQSLQKKYTDKGVVWLAVNSTNDQSGEFMSVADLKKNRTEWKSAYTAQLIDADGKVGRLYNAKTTPHMFIVDKDGKLVYQGGIDDAAGTSGGKDAKVNYVAQALDAVLAGKEVPTATTKSYGCSVKYATK
ncbi:MAG: thioredoxin family protein [Rhizobacter sp.]|nr:thioredoxin family protein [Chlorobiales bacterium]